MELREFNEYRLQGRFIRVRIRPSEIISLASRYNLGTHGLMERNKLFSLHLLLFFSTLAISGVSAEYIWTGTEWKWENPKPKPTMTKVKVVVSNDGYGGTVDNVAMKFTNGDGEVCFTNHSSVYLSDVQTFSGGSTVVVDAERSTKEKTALGDCATGTFRPDEELTVEILINTASFFVFSYWYDGYTFRQGFYIV